MKDWDGTRQVVQNGPHVYYKCYRQGCAKKAAYGEDPNGSPLYCRRHA